MCKIIKPVINVAATAANITREKNTVEIEFAHEPSTESDEGDGGDAGRDDSLWLCGGDTAAAAALDYPDTPDLPLRTLPQGLQHHDVFP